jgi:hypothetical protein
MLSALMDGQSSLLQGQSRIETHLASPAGSEPNQLVMGSWPAAGADFVEREALAELAALLEESAEVTLVSLHGLRGVGKSLIAGVLATRCVDAG